MSDDRTDVDDCWNRIGVWSKTGASCERLPEVVHCRNCPVFIAAGRTIFEREPPAGYLQENLAAFADAGTAVDRDSLGIMVFRLGVEYFALLAEVFEAVTEARPVHRLPHVSNPFVKGVVNISGEVCLCHSLHAALAVATVHNIGDEEDRHVYRRLVVTRIADARYVFPVDEIKGMHRYRKDDLKAAPATIDNEIRQLIRGTFSLDGETVAVLDDDGLHRIFHAGAY